MSWFKTNWNSRLLKASEKGNLADVKRALEEGANINAMSERDGTALNLACLHKHSDVALYLIEQKAELNIQDCLKNTALIIAACKGLPDIAEALIKAGAKIEIKGWGDYTALAWAAEGNEQGLFDALFEAGASPENIAREHIEKFAPHLLRAASPPSEVYEKIGQYEIVENDGWVKSLGEVQTIFNFEARTTERVIDKHAGSPTDFDIKNKEKTLRAYEWARSQGMDVEHPFKNHLEFKNAERVPALDKAVMKRA